MCLFLEANKTHQVLMSPSHDKYSNKIHWSYCKL